MDYPLLSFFLIRDHGELLVGPVGRAQLRTFGLQTRHKAFRAPVVAKTTTNARDGGAGAGVGGTLDSTEESGPMATFLEIYVLRTSFSLVPRPYLLALARPSRLRYFPYTVPQPTLMCVSPPDLTYTSTPR